MGLGDVEGSWLEAWRMGSSWTSKMMLVVAKGHILEVWTISDMIRLKSISWGHGGWWGFLIGDLEDGVIYDIIDHVYIYDWEDILKVWWRSDMIWLRKSFSLGWVGCWVFSKFKDQFKPINIWVISGQHLANILPLSWQYIGNILTISWQYHTNILAVIMQYEGIILTISWQ